MNNGKNIIDYPFDDDPLEYVSGFYLGSFIIIICICVILYRIRIRNNRHNIIISPPLSPISSSSSHSSRYDNIILISNIKCLINDDCPICIEPFKENDELYQLKCGHIFHTECITEWININNICPTCRKDVINDV